MASYQQLSSYEELMVRIKELRNAGRTSAQIADQLNDEGFHSPSCNSFNAPTIRRLLSCNGTSHDRERIRIEQPQWRLRDLAEKLDMPTTTLCSWLHRGWLHGRQMEGARGRWLIWADDDELNRLTQLRQHRLESTGRPASTELTTPRPRPEN